jgi:hypothetical protein
MPIHNHQLPYSKVQLIQTADLQVKLSSSLEQHQALAKQPHGRLLKKERAFTFAVADRIFQFPCLESGSDAGNSGASWLCSLCWGANVFL